MVSQHFAASSADVHFSSHAFSSMGASLVVFTILISGFFGASSIVASATAAVASATAASVACDAMRCVAMACSRVRVPRFVAL